VAQWLCLPRQRRVREAFMHQYPEPLCSQELQKRLGGDVHQHTTALWHPFNRTFDPRAAQCVAKSYLKNDAAPVPEEEEEEEEE
jgi:hypothetical protein